MKIDIVWVIVISSLVALGVFITSELFIYGIDNLHP